MPRPVATLVKDLTAAIRGGHPWIFDRALRASARWQAGEVVQVRHGREAIAIGYADPGAPIAVRVIDNDPAADPDASWARALARRAARRRATDPRLAASTGLRLIHGENDGLPGLVIDSYAGFAAVIFDGAGAAAFWRPRLDAVIEGLGDAGFPLQSALIRRQGKRGGEPELAWGDEPPELVTIEENGARFEVDLRRGQKTGFFLDQRDNRLVARELAAGASVLNLFGYTGGFSVHAALGGAARVTTVDIAAGAIAAAKRNFARNQLDAAAHRFVVDDVRRFLDGSDEQFELVVCDPPSYAPSERVRGRALAAYRDLNRGAIDAVAPGGVLLTASCSSHVTESDLIDAVGTAARSAGRELVLREIRGAATDHPLRPGFPEGRYLNLLVAVLD